MVHDEEGPYIVSTYWEIHGLLHDPRLSSEARDLDPEAAPELVEEDDPGLLAQLPAAGPARTRPAAPTGDGALRPAAHPAPAPRHAR
ncbi:hypothetical protein SANTM175S_03988 [Streptomyces antimycoticus]